jgi:glycine C-acetyltransferase
MADELLKSLCYWFFSCSTKDKARIRVQLSAAHTKEHLDKAIAHLLKLETLNVV